MLSSAEGVVAGYVGEVAGVVDGEDSYVAAAADLEAVDAAIGCDEPRRLLGISADGSHQVESHKTDRTCVREYRDALALMLAHYFPYLVHCPLDELAVALAAGDHMMVVAINQRVVVLWMMLL